MPATLAISEDEVGRQSGQQPNGKRALAVSPRLRSEQSTDKQWEVRRTWENVVEGEDGTISSAVESLLEATKRKRVLRDTTPFQRGIIRHVVFILDLSFAMAEKDLRPTRYLLTLRYAQDFVKEFFEQNPLSELCVVGMKDGLGIRISDMSGNPNDHIAAIELLKPQDPKGDPSLQNALEMARGILSNSPGHGTREVILILGALMSSDPGNIHDTISALEAASIRVHVIGLAAQVAVCRELVAKTNGGDDSGYGVVLDELHFRDLLMEATTPPVTILEENVPKAEPLLPMGFPSRVIEETATLCSCHCQMTDSGYRCPQCQTKVCSLPTNCPACDLTLVLSSHLARSYHHLFPLLNWIEVPWSKASRSRECRSCLSPFPEIPPKIQWNQNKPGKDVSESGRYECPACHEHFCVECDVFCHNTLHVCPGCQSKPQAVPTA